jgi:hypothetical protein
MNKRILNEAHTDYEVFQKRHGLMPSPWDVDKRFTAEQKVLKQIYTDTLDQMVAIDGSYGSKKSNTDICPHKLVENNLKFHFDSMGNLFVPITYSGKQAEFIQSFDEEELEKFKNKIKYTVAYGVLSAFSKYRHFSIIKDKKFIRVTAHVHFPQKYKNDFNISFGIKEDKWLKDEQPKAWTHIEESSSPIEDGDVKDYIGRYFGNLIGQVYRIIALTKAGEPLDNISELNSALENMKSVFESVPSLFNHVSEAIEDFLEIVYEDEITEDDCEQFYEDIKECCFELHKKLK